ncbi:3-hydroxyacyl-CoA dehydrogenase family protein [Streptomyces sp. bgisy091]|uniref:3-hydroxyacyl-CoA dehydrogenase family protein n=1 Tax=Streptomyces sp. bgisy091 TaxID=3413778 RepID=UPI003D702C5F
MTTETTTYRLAVIGAGVMGVGISALALGRGVSVVLVDIDPVRREQARDRVEQELRLSQFMGGRDKDGPVGELVTTGSLADVAGVDAVIEAVTEEAPLKVKALTEVSAVVAEGTLLVTNTSSIPVDETAHQVPRPEDLVGIHFMNPSYLIRTVEVIPGSRTGEAALASVKELLTVLDRRGVFVGDGPGFVTSAVLHRMINDAIRIVGEGRASIEDVDTLMQDCLGHRTGPLRTADLIGLDNLADSLRVLHERTGDEGCRPAELLLHKVREGHHGRKSGRGFYVYGAVIA